MEQVTLGKKYRDRTTGFEGVATSRTEFLYGCHRVGLEALVSGEVKHHTFDEPGLELVNDNPVVEPTPRERRTGGERPTPSRLTR